MLLPRHLPLLATYVQVCRAGSFTKAAKALAISKSLASHHVLQLEEALGVRLLERSTRGVALTEVGERVRLTSNELLRMANEISDVADIGQRKPTGTLKVGAPVDLGRILVAPVVGRLCYKYQGLRAELVLSDTASKGGYSGLDAVLCVNVPKDSARICTRLGADREIIVGSPRISHFWRGACGPRELSQAPWVAHPALPSVKRRAFVDGEGRRQRLSLDNTRAVANTSDALLMLVLEGAGLAIVPSQMVAKELQAGQLVHVLPAWKGRTVKVQVCFPSPNPPARVVAFLEELRAEFTVSGFDALYAAGKED